MEFKKQIKKVELLAPPDFKFEVQEIEYREDPLTNSRSIINVKRAGRVKQTQTANLMPETFIKETSNACFFCPGQIEIKTPNLPPHIFAQGKLKRGECILFPNLYPFAEYHAVATLSREHFLALDQFKPEMLVDNLLLCQEWLLKVYEKDKEAKYPLYMWNHLPPSAASIVHPHVQVIVRREPTSMQAELLAKSREYFENNGQSYWKDLLEEEKSLDERYIGENDSLAVIASYAPRGFREIQFIFKEASNLAELDLKQIEDFANAVIKVLRSYKQMGVGSFNLCTFSGPIGERLDYYALNAKLISRPFPQGIYTNDTGPFERLQDEWVIETLPEEIARKVKEGFK